jgi:hypothetical protein
MTVINNARRAKLAIKDLNERHLKGAEESLTMIRTLVLRLKLSWWLCQERLAQETFTAKRGCPDLLWLSLEARHVHSLRHEALEGKTNYSPSRGESAWFNKRKV